MKRINLSVSAMATRPSGGPYDNTNPVSITITDEVAGMRILEINIPAADFADFLTARPVEGIPCELYIDDRIGKIREHKTVTIDITSHTYDCDLRPFLEPFEIDGWIGTGRDLKNHHCHFTANGTRMAEVLFTRWIDKTPNRQD